MRFVVNDEPVAALTEKSAGSPILAKVVEKAVGMVMTPEDATRAYVRQNSQWLILLAGLAIAVMFAIIVAGASYEPSSGSFFAAAGLVVASALVAFMYFLLRHRTKRWNEKLAYRQQGLAPAGTTVSIDGNGLILGAETFTWGSLAIDLLELIAFYTTSGSASGTIDADRTHLIERVLLKATDGRALVLDRYMISNGPILVDNVWRRLKKPTK